MSNKDDDELDNIIKAAIKGGNSTDIEIDLSKDLPLQYSAQPAFIEKNDDQNPDQKHNMTSTNEPPKKFPFADYRQTDETIEHENSRQNPQENRKDVIPHDNKDFVDTRGPNKYFTPFSSRTDAVKLQIQENNQITGYVNSTKARHKAEGEMWDAQQINYCRQQLIHRKIEPLPKYLCVSEPFPIDKLPEKAGQLINSVAQFLQVPIEAVGPALLGAIFIAARGNFKIKVKTGYFEALTAYIVVAAPPSTKKSGIVDIFRSIFDKIEGELKAEYKSNITRINLKNDLLDDLVRNQKRESLKEIPIDNPGHALDKIDEIVKKLEPFEKARTSKKLIPRFLTDSPTPKALAVEMSRQGEAIGIFEAEGGIWKHRLRVNDDTIFLKGYTMESFGDETNTGDSVVMQHPCLAICSVMQNGVTEKLFSKTDLTKDGLISRILPVFPPQLNRLPDPHPKALNEDLKNWYENKIEGFLKLKRPACKEDERTFHTLELEPESFDFFEEFAHEVATQICVGDFKACEEFAGKLAGSAVRLAGAVHLLQHDDPHLHPINLSAMEAGIVLARFFAKHAQVFFDLDKVIGHEFARKILKWIDRYKRNTFTEREAERGVSHCKVADIRNGLILLDRHGYLTQCPTSENKILAIVHPYYDYSGAQQKFLTVLY